MKFWLINEIAVYFWTTSFFAGSLCAKIEVDVEAEPVSPQLVAAAIKSGVGLRSREKPLRPSKYVAAYLKKLTYSYEEDKVREEVHTAWQEVLLCLEERGRKLVTVADKVVTLTLFCPTIDSRKQLYDSLWVERLTETFGRLIQLLGTLIWLSFIICYQVKCKKFLGQYLHFVISYEQHFLNLKVPHIQNT